MEPTIKDILDLSFERYNGFQILWSFYITVAIGIIAYVGAASSLSSTGFVRFLIATGFILFAAVNLYALDKVREQRDLLADAAVSHLKPSGENSISEDDDRYLRISESNRPPERWELLSFHLFSDLLIVTAIWFVPGVLATARRFASFREGEMDRASSPFQPVLLSRSEQTGTWTLERDYYLSVADWTFNIPKGFEFDLASVPKPLWWVIAPFELSIAAPLVHDYCYVFNGSGPAGTIVDRSGDDISISKSEADLLFLKIMRLEGVSLLRRSAAYAAVAVFGSLFWKTRTEALKIEQASGDNGGQRR